MRLVVLFLLLVPAAGALGIDNPSGSHDATLFLHLNGNQELRMTPQAPPESFADDVFTGFVGSNCIETPGQTFTDQSHHTWYAVVSPEPMDYRDGRPHGPDRGMRGDLHLNEGTMRLDWYIRNGVNDNEGDAPAPQVSLRATLREGDQISVQNQAMNKGRILAQAETQPVALTPEVDNGETVDYGDGIYGFHLDIPVAAAIVPASEGINLRIDLRIANPVCDDAGGYVTPPNLGAHTSAAFRPALQLSHATPVTIERMAVHARDSGISYEAEIRAPFGSADAILTRDHFHIEGPTQPQALVDIVWQDAIERDGRFHHKHMMTARDRYVISGGWSHLDDAAADGEYTLSFGVGTESQGWANGTLQFAIGDERRSCSVIGDAEPTCSTAVAGKKSPAPLGLAVLVAAALLRRR